MRQHVTALPLLEAHSAWHKVMTYLLICLGSTFLNWDALSPFSRVALTVDTMNKPDVYNGRSGLHKCFWSWALGQIGCYENA